MKVIFLDFYGVMDGPADRSLKSKIESELDPLCGKMINDLCKVTDAKIVISSDAVKNWFGKDNPRRFVEAQNDLIKCGIDKSRIIGYTLQGPMSNAYFHRGAEIRAWLRKHPTVNKFVIFDDKALILTRERIEFFSKSLELYPSLKKRFPEPDDRLFKRFIKVNPEFGLRSRDINRALKLLR